LLVITGSADSQGGTWFNPGYLRALDADERSWSELRVKPGPRSRPDLPRQFGQMPAVAMVDEIESGGIRALIVLGASLLTCMPDTERTRRALRSLEMLLVVDVMANETTELATHLAACAGQLERADLSLSNDQYLPAVAVQYTPAVVAPGAGRRELWWIVASLLEELGRPVLPGGRPPAEVTTDDILAPPLDPCAGDFEALRRAGVLVKDEAVYGWVARQVQARGGWRLAPPELVGLLNHTPDPEGLVLIPRRQARHFNSQLVGTADLAGGQDDPYLLVHPDDARAAGLEDGGRAEVRSAYGTLVGVVAVDPDIRRGAVSLPHGFAGPHVNQLTSLGADIDPMTGMPRFNALPVTLAPVPAP
jgi:anaerobic selenocysteine-containing dehydrogenase